MELEYEMFWSYLLSIPCLRGLQSMGFTHSHIALWLYLNAASIELEQRCLVYQFRLVYMVLASGCKAVNILHICNSITLVCCILDATAGLALPKFGCSCI
uniref:Uncharacterized protein n=1 Tax=Setaria viridis TaxID=4556 RepID=A0A4U6WJG3_SETVI|nr:hypothetical protein SEVIR_1G360700v2 [Setaria viridis]